MGSRSMSSILMAIGLILAVMMIMKKRSTSLPNIGRNFYQKMGFIRYMVLANLLLFMMSLPIKMVLRWSFNLKYLIAIPEYFLNF